MKGEYLTGGIDGADELDEVLVVEALEDRDLPLHVLTALSVVELVLVVCLDRILLSGLLFLSELDNGI